MKTRKWNFSDDYSVDYVGPSEEGVWMGEDENPLPEGVVDELKILVPHAGEDTSLSLVIAYHREGYYESASMYGGADHMGWPSEGDDDVVEEKVSVVENKKVIGYLTPKSAGILFDMYESNIRDIETDSDY